MSYLAQIQEGSPIFLLHEHIALITWNKWEYHNVQNDYLL
jgi:hypothetical protein